MNHRQMPRLLSTTVVAAAALLLVACGGGSGSAPPAAAPAAAIDTSAPVVTIAKSTGDGVATGPVTFSFTFNKDVGTSFTVDDIVVTGGTKSAFTRLSGTGATLVVTPTPDTTGTVQVSLAAGAVIDALGNASTAANSTLAFNTVAQTVLVNFGETPAPTLTGFGGAGDSTVAIDPTDSANKVARIVKSATAETWAGTTVSICPNQAVVALPFTSTRTRLTARVWSPAAGVPVRMKVENAADDTKFVETEATTTVANGWQTLSFNFAAQVTGTPALNLANTYNKVSVFFNFGTGGAATGARTYFLDDITFAGANFSVACSSAGGGAATTATISMDEATPPGLTGFGGAEDSTIVADPTGGTNKVVRVVRSATAETFAGTTVSTLPGAAIPRIGFSDTAKVITVRVWSPTAGTPVLLKVEDATNDQRRVETLATTSVANAWQTLSFNFANHATGTPALNLANTYNKLTIFFNFGTTGQAAGGARTYYFEDIVYPVASSGGGSAGGGASASPLLFASGYRQGGGTAQGGSWGYFSGDFSNYINTFTGGGFADSNPPVADNDQYFFIAVITSAPTAPAGSPPTSGGFLGMYVTHPGLTLSGQTSLEVNLGMDEQFFKQTSNKNIDVRVVGATTYSNGSGGNCNVTLKGTVTPTTNAMIAYTLPLAGMTLEQPCNGGGFNSGVTSVAQALAQPIGAVNTQFSFPNVNTTTVNPGGGSPVYATGLTRGKTTFK